MTHTELMSRFKKLEEGGLFVEAFILRSLYVESVISTLSSSIRSYARGFDGKERSVSEAVKNDPEFRKEFESFEGDHLNEKIKDLHRAKFINDAQSSEIHEWKNKYRKEVFHHFTRYFLVSGVLEETCKNGYELIKKISESTWFKHIENALVKMEQKSALSK